MSEKCVSIVQVRVVSSWNGTRETSETRLELKQPFTSTLSQLHLHTLSQSFAGEQRSSQQVHTSLNKDTLSHQRRHTHTYNHTFHCVCPVYPDASLLGQWSAYERLPHPEQTVAE